ncbi:MAG: glycosyltransferase [Syntrophorhabdales bacterium]
MRILTILPSISLLTGGAARSVLALCKTLASAGHQVHMLTTLWPEDCQVPKSGVERRIDGYTIRIFPTETYLPARSLPHSPALLRALDSLCSSSDMTVSHSLWNPIATFSMKLLRERKLPYAIMAHGMLDPLVLRRNRWKKLPWSMVWEKRNVEGAVMVLFNSEAERTKAELSRFRLARTFIMPHPIDLAFWAALPPRNTLEQALPQIRGCEVILYVGRLNWVKNLDKLLHALKLVRRRGRPAVLLCVGPDSDGEQKRMESQAQALGLADHIFFTGLQEGKELKAAYSRANLLVLVSKKENFGLVVAEALASGLPVVVSEGVDVAAGWKSSGPVRRVKPEPEAISEAILDLLDRGDKHALPDAEARNLAEREWGRTRIVELVDRYQQILKERAL